MPATPGRPLCDTETREVLLEKAKYLFASQGYAKVTTRSIAHAANVNAAMIRYYYGDKAGLFEAVVTSTIQPLADFIQEQSLKSVPAGPALFVKKYYELMALAPEMPKLVFRSLNDEGSAEHEIVSRVFGKFLKSMLAQLDYILAQPESLRPNISSKYAVVSCLSLSIFPFLMPDLIKKHLGIELDPQFLTNLGFHQEQLLQNGLMPELE